MQEEASRNKLEQAGYVHGPKPIQESTVSSSEIGVDREVTPDLTPEDRHPPIRDEAVFQDQTLQIRITEEPLTAQNFTSIIASINELYTKAWLIHQGRFSDLINYAQTHDIRFTKEANLVIGKLALNSPTLIELLLSPAALGATATVAFALKTSIDAVIQIPLRFKATELENQKKELEMKIRQEEAQQVQQIAARKAQLEIETQQLEVERQRLKVEIKRIEIAVTASKMVETLRPGIDTQIKGFLCKLYYRVFYNWTMLKG